MLLRFGFLIGTIITLGISSLSALPLNGMTTGELSDMWTTLLTPAGFTFSIRGVIYTLLMIVGISIAIKKITISSRTLYRYLASCFFNSAWIFARHYEQLFLSRAIIVGLWVTIVGMIDAHDHSQKIIADTSSTFSSRLTRSVRHIFFFYFGRVSVATLVLTSIIVIHDLPGGTIDPMIWYIGVLTAASILFCRVATTKRTLAHLFVLLRARYGIYQGYREGGVSQDETTLRIVLIVTGCFVGFCMLFWAYDKINRPTMSHRNTDKGRNERK